MNMSESGFFNNTVYPDVGTTLELIHSSRNGWAKLYMLDKDGRFRVYKALKQEFRGDARYEALLRKEYEIGYKLSHPHLCEIYGFVDMEPLGNCIEMEWIDGVPLGQYLSGKKLTKESSRRIILQICDALEYCHSRQIVHRDIKPENIMITHSGHNVKLLDFGLSDSDAHSIFKSACGTAVFAAPELFEGACPDIRSDIYSLGKVISLFHGPFSQVAAVCMRKNPSKRYPDVDSVRTAVLKAARNKWWRWLFLIPVMGALAVTLVPGVFSHVLERPSFVLPAESATDSSAVPSGDTVDVQADPPSSMNPVIPSEAKPVVRSESHPEQEEFIDTAAIDELFNLATSILEEK